jgi:preprotein translocase subunit SecD
MDDYVFLSPGQRRNSTGSSSISGAFDAQEAEDLANLLKSGTMRPKCEIIQGRNYRAFVG